MQKTFAQVELSDGQEFNDVRVTMQDKLQFERTARLKKWDAQENYFTFAAFVAWHATKRENLHSLTWDEFEASAVDATIRTEGEDEGDGDLTQS